MKRIICIAGLVAAPYCFSQGTFLYDQQSSTNEGLPAFGSGSSIQALVPSTGQSFTPSLSGVDFIRLLFNDGNISDGLGASISLNVRSGSITGPILGSTSPVTMPNGFRGPVNFFLPTIVPLTPGTTYFFDLAFQSGGPWNVDIESHIYPGGQAYVQGQPDAASDYWFREGLYVVPEPSCSSLVCLGAGVAVLARIRSMRRRP